MTNDDDITGVLNSIYNNTTSFLTFHFVFFWVGRVRARLDSVNDCIETFGLYSMGLNSE
jgi:hypothetical protein